MIASCLCHVMLAVAQLSSGELQGIEGLHGLGAVVHHGFQSGETDHRYVILVGLPGDYEESNGRRYPVVYVLDGGIHFPVLRGYHDYMTNSGDVPEVIFVGVSYGTDDWRQGNNRSHDFTAPSREREHWGGAGDFLDFLELELIPGIEATYRADSGRRVLFGQSLGGQFVLYAAQTRPEAFWGYIASNPALHRNLDFFLEATPPRASNGCLFVASGSADAPRFREPAVAWMQHWTAVESPPWSLEAVTLDGHTHFSAPPIAYRLGMQWLFGADRNTGCDE